MPHESHDLCIHCSVLPCVPWCRAVITGGSKRPPTVPEVLQPFHVRRMIEERRQYARKTGEMADTA